MRKIFLALVLLVGVMAPIGAESAGAIGSGTTTCQGSTMWYSSSYSGAQTSTAGDCTTVRVKSRHCHPVNGCWYTNYSYGWGGDVELYSPGTQNATHGGRPWWSSSYVYAWS